MSAKRATARKLPSRSRPASDGGRQIKVAAAKGRPMLTWVGKRPLSQVTAFPAQHIERFDPAGELAKPRTEDMWSEWPVQYPKGGLLFHGDNKEVLAHLLANGFRGKVHLIYIDPPFDSGADYVRKVSLRGPSGTARIEGQGYTLGEQIQYTDIWANDEYLQFMYERLLLLRELLADGGSFFLHCDQTKGHHLRMLLDEVFGPDRFVNEIIWSYRRWPSDTNAFQSMHDTILFYANETSRKRTFHKAYEDASESYLRRFRGKTQVLDPDTRTRKITSHEETKGMPLRDVWDISIVAGFKGERTSYPTQKPKELIARIIGTCSNPGDLVLDSFVGSGTTLAVAQELGRRWIGCDINKGAIQTASAVVQRTTGEQSRKAQGALIGENLRPAQLSFTTWRVNDYDLTIPHEEAVALACDHLGVQRTRTDPFFDGTLGRSLVKVISFTHPLSPLDLERVKEELNARPNEDRAVTVVCLGIELAAQKWVDEWNRRPGRRAANRIEIAELRSDPRYGGLIRHEPAVARVDVSRQGESVLIEVKDFISPTIIERLAQQAGIVKPKIDDWRQMVDCVMIDASYDGEVFEIDHSDLPAKKTEYVAGRYELPAPRGKTTVAVKILDMLGEELLVTCDV